MTIFAKVITIKIPTPPSIPSNATWILRITLKNTKDRAFVNVKPPRDRRTLKLYSGAPKLNTSSPPLSWLLLGILPRANNSAL